MHISSILHSPYLQIYEWKPEPYKTAEDLELAKERGMPQQLVDLIKGYIATGDARVINKYLN